MVFDLLRDFQALGQLVQVRRVCEMMFSFSGDTYRHDSTYAGSASGLNFLLYAMSVVVRL
jgi:hypothetical protein